MSGGPLINDLGEVVGIVTLVTYGMTQSEMGTFVVEDQPVALPIHLVRKHIMTNNSLVSVKSRLGTERRPSD